MESFVAVMAIIAASIIDPGLYFAMNAPAGVVGGDRAVRRRGGHQPRLHHHARASCRRGRPAVEEQTLVARTGGAPTLAVGMSTIFAGAFGGDGLKAFWYHFAIMFEALFILTTVDARHAGRALHAPGHPRQRLEADPAGLAGGPACGSAARSSSAAWGYFLYAGVTDPLGGINQLFPLFGIANQLLAAVALTVCTVLLIKHGKLKWAWVTGIPLAWDAAVTLTASYQKVFSADPKLGFFAQRDRFKDALARGGPRAGQDRWTTMHAGRHQLDRRRRAGGVLRDPDHRGDRSTPPRIAIKAIRAGEPLPTTEVPAEESHAARARRAVHPRRGPRAGGADGRPRERRHAACAGTCARCRASPPTTATSSIGRREHRASR